MKKNIIILTIILLIICGCNFNKEEKPKEKEEEQDIQEIVEDDEVVEEPKEEYVDENNTPIAIYLNRKKVTDYKSDMAIGKDIVKFQVVTSNDEKLSYSGSFGQFFHNKFNEYNKNNNLKIGFNLTYDVSDGRHFSHNVLHATDTKKYEGYILLFLYDDYDLYTNNKIYAHFEKETEKSNTIISSIKLYPGGAVHKITSQVKLTVFTYDGEDDFDENGEYRGNSKYSIMLCETGRTC